jgi:pyridoxine kinase
VAFKILTVQSHVVYGYVGNKVATFALQRLGNEVLPINTLQFSNHTGYEKWHGQVFTAEHVEDVIIGLKENDMLYQCNAIITGYIGDESIGEVVLSAVDEIKSQNKSAIYCCDPVMGDTEQGFYVNADVQKYMRLKAISNADIITPNQFEASALANQKIETLEDAQLVARKLFSLGPRIIVITSMFYSGMEFGAVANMVFDGINFYICQTPYIASMNNVSGTGDLFASVFLSHYLKGNEIEQVLQMTVSSVYSIIEASSNQKNLNELSVVDNQGYLLNPQHFFSVKKL